MAGSDDGDDDHTPLQEQEKAPLDPEPLELVALVEHLKAGWDQECLARRQKAYPTLGPVAVTWVSSTLKYDRVRNTVFRCLRAEFDLSKVDKKRKEMMASSMLLRCGGSEGDLLGSAEAFLKLDIVRVDVLGVVLTEADASNVLAEHNRRWPTVEVLIGPDAGPWRRVQRGLQRVQERLLSGPCVDLRRVLRPLLGLGAGTPPPRPPPQDVARLDPTLDDVQVAVLCHALTQVLTLVMGPPGTGKTVLLSHLSRLWRTGPGDKVLGCFATNAAMLDFARMEAAGNPGTKMLVLLGKRAELPAGDPLRRCTLEHQVAGLGMDSARHTYLRQQHETATPGLDYLQGGAGQAGAVPAEHRGGRRRHGAVHLQHGGQQGAGRRQVHRSVRQRGRQGHGRGGHAGGGHGAKRIALFGDICLPGPQLASPAAAAAGLQVSTLQRVERGGFPHFLLRVQYRMAKPLAAYPYAFFYNGQVVNSSEAETRPPLYDWLPYLTCLSHQGNTKQAGTSRVNVGEVNIVRGLVRELERRGALKDVVVLALYAAAVDALQAAFAEEGLDVPVFTVNAFQGREANVVVLCTECGLSATGPNVSKWADNPCVINLALTRAKHHLIIVANAWAPREAALWAGVLHHCSQTHCLLDGGPVAAKTAWSVRHVGPIFATLCQSAVDIKEPKVVDLWSKMDERRALLTSPPGAPTCSAFLKRVQPAFLPEPATTPPRKLIDEDNGVFVLFGRETGKGGLPFEPQFSVLRETEAGQVREGPFRSQKMKTRFKEGQLTESDLVRSDAMDNNGKPLMAEGMWVQLSILAEAAKGAAVKQHGGKYKSILDMATLFEKLPACSLVEVPATNYSVATPSQPTSGAELGGGGRGGGSGGGGAPRGNDCGGGGGRQPGRAAGQQQQQPAPAQSLAAYQQQPNYGQSRTPAGNQGNYAPQQQQQQTGRGNQARSGSKGEREAAANMGYSQATSPQPQWGYKPGAHGQQPTAGTGCSNVDLPTGATGARRGSDAPLGDGYEGGGCWGRGRYDAPRSGGWYDNGDGGRRGGGGDKMGGRNGGDRGDGGGNGFVGVSRGGGGQAGRW